MEEPQFTLDSKSERTLKYWRSLVGRRRGVLSSLLAVLLLVGAYAFFYRTPYAFPIGTIVTVEYGESLQSITNALHEAGTIQSPFIFRSAVILMGGEKNVIAGDYLLDKRESPISLAYRLVKGDFHLELTKVTIPEGWNVQEIAGYLDKSLLEFDEAHFLALAQDKEGYLFPDTYFVSPVVTPEKIIDMMSKNFSAKVDELYEESESKHPLADIIAMASIVEAEARTTESRKMVAGILWKRIQTGMMLQVDATFKYVNGKSTFDLTLDDLKIDSPYNTYKYKGLPKTPINNPGLDAIEATLNPTASKYVYFLTSKSGKMYYAETFAQHKKNKELYLND